MLLVHFVTNANVVPMLNANSASAWRTAPNWRIRCDQAAPCVHFLLAFSALVPRDPKVALKIQFAALQPRRSKKQSTFIATAVGAHASPASVMFTVPTARNPAHASRRE
jgi:hypothetical protein